MRRHLRALARSMDLGLHNLPDVLITFYYRDDAPRLDHPSTTRRSRPRCSRLVLGLRPRRRHRQHYLAEIRREEMAAGSRGGRHALHLQHVWILGRRRPLSRAPRTDAARRCVAPGRRLVPPNAQRWQGCEARRDCVRPGGRARRGRRSTSAARGRNSLKETRSNGTAKTETYWNARAIKNRAKARFRILRSLMLYPAELRVRCCFSTTYFFLSVTVPTVPMLEFQRTVTDSTRGAL